MKQLCKGGNEMEIQPLLNRPDVIKYTYHDFDVEKIRLDFPILDQKIEERPLIYLDNAATTQKPSAVINAIAHYYSRENSNIHRRLPYETLVNHSIVQTLQRSINTQLMTVEFMLLALALLGGVTLRQFSFVLLIGLLSGTYSSICISAPSLVVWENKEWRNWRPFRRSTQPA